MIYRHSAGGVIVHENRVLTISWTTHNYVAFPKGGIDSNETSKEAAVREVFEETGYKARIISPIKSYTHNFDRVGKQHHHTVDYYLMELVDNNPPKPQREKGEDFENLWLDINDAYEKLTFDDAKDSLRIAEEILKKV